MGFIRDLKDLKKQDLILTPRLGVWLMEHQHVPVVDPQLLVDIVTDESNNVRHGRFGASSRGDCLRQQVFKFQKAPQRREVDARLSLIFQDGTWRHIRWQMMLIAAGLATHVEVPFEYPEKRLTVSIDALNEEEAWLFELKGAWQIPHEVPHKHLLQIHTYFYVTGYDTCVYMVEEKGTQVIKEWVVRKDPNIYKEVEKEINALNRSIQTKSLPPILPARYEGKGAAPCNKCAFRDLCTEAGDWYERPQEA